MFIPATVKEVEKRGWDSLDVIIVSGDGYIDSYFNGAAIIGHWLIENGFKVGMISQPSMDSKDDIMRFGDPNLFWSVTAGSMDSMVANYTPDLRRRKHDDITPGGLNNKRPDRACIAYTNLIKRSSKGIVVLGGIEASLRRVVHYDYWSNSLRRSILFDSKADAITYGMGELANQGLAERIKKGEDWRDLDGICHISKEAMEGFDLLPSFEECNGGKGVFKGMFEGFLRCSKLGRGMSQGHGNRFLIQNPSSRDLTSQELDQVHSLDYMNSAHPSCLKEGKIKAMETIKSSITTHRGCYGECSFCAIALHQGKGIVSRSRESILEEVDEITSRDGFNGMIYDVGGPTANMYGTRCGMNNICERKCLYPSPCKNLVLDHGPQICLLKDIRHRGNVKKAFVSSGIRYDMVVNDRKNGKEYLDEIVGNHVSGQMKIAPEHTSENVLRHMGKPESDTLLRFKGMFEESNVRQGKRQFLTYYLMAAHPGCGIVEMNDLNRFVHRELRTNPEQIQIFTPTPSTVSTMMYYTGLDMNGDEVFVECDMRKKVIQKNVILNGGRTDGRGP